MGKTGLRSAKLTELQKIKQTVKTGSFVEFLEGLDKFGDSLAIVDKAGGKWRESTYSQLLDDVFLLSAGFTDRNISQTHIAVLSENRYEWIVAYLAIVVSGNVAIPLDNELSDSELLYLIKYSDSRAILYSKTFISLMENNREELGGVQWFIGFDGAGKYSGGKNDGSLPDGAGRHGSDEVFISYEKFISRDSAPRRNFRSLIKTAENAAAVIVFTSGTTGASKGVMLSEKNILSVVAGGADFLNGNDPTMTVLPLYHTFGMACALLSLKMKSPLTLNDKVKNFSENMNVHKPYNLLAVPIYVEKIYGAVMGKLRESGKLKPVMALIKLSNNLLKLNVDVRKTVFRRIRESLGGNLDLIMTGGAPLAAVYSKFFNEIGIRLLQGYGITECSPMITINPTRAIRYASVGVPLNCCEVKIDEKGEILVRGDNVMLGYYKSPERTEEAIGDGWFRTGDVGRLDDDGYLYITGRLKNIILLSNGKNVYPEEIEERALLSGAIDEAVVYCSDNDVIVLEYYSSSGAIDDIGGVVAGINSGLPMYSQIGRAISRDAPFPKTTTYKIRRDSSGKAVG